MDYLIYTEKEHSTLVIDTLKDFDKSKVSIIESDHNFIFNQYLPINKRIRNSFILIGIFFTIFTGLGILTISEFKPLYSPGNIFLIFFTMHIGLLISIIVSLENITTAYTKKKISSTKLASIIGAVLGGILGGIMGYAILQIELEELPALQKPIGAFMFSFLIFFSLILLVIQLFGFVINYFINTSKIFMKIINSIVLLVTIVLTYFYMMYLVGIISDTLLILIPLLLIVIDFGLYIVNIFIFKNKAISQIVVTPQRIIWVIENRIDYYRFKEISKIEVGDSKVIITIKGAFHVVKEINMANQIENIELIRILGEVCQKYLTIAHDELRAERKVTNQ